MCRVRVERYRAFSRLKSCGKAAAADHDLEMEVRDCFVVNEPDHGALNSGYSDGHDGSITIPASARFVFSFFCAVRISCFSFVLFLVDPTGKSVMFFLAIEASKRSIQPAQ